MFSLHCVSKISQPFMGRQGIFLGLLYRYIRVCRSFVTFVLCDIQNATDIDLKII